VHWLYTQKLPEKYSAWLRALPSEEYQGHKAFEMSMIRVRVFANRFMVDGLSQVMECVLIRYLFDTHACYEVVAYAYNHLPKGNQTLTKMIHSHCSSILRSCLCLSLSYNE
jgi:hypothetical protein